MLLQVLGSSTRVCFVDDDVICEQFSVTEEIFLLNSADTVKVHTCASGLYCLFIHLSSLLLFLSLCVSFSGSRSTQHCSRPAFERTGAALCSILYAQS